MLNLSVEEGLRRAKNRAELDRFEEEDIAFHRRIQQSYLERATQYPDRITVIDVDGLTESAVFDRIKEGIKEQ